MKTEIIQELKNKAKELNRSPGRRNFSYTFYRKCVKIFGSFNNAKLEAGLKISKRVCEPLSKEFMKLDSDLVELVSFLTCDGHLSKDLKGFHLYSKDVGMLKRFSLLIKRKFGIFGQYKGKSDGYGECTTYQVFNTNICKFLHSVGTPKGSKIKVKFSVPDWIKFNEEFSRVYLKIAYYCEGCFKEPNRKNPRVGFNMNKDERILEDGVCFMEELKEILNGFGIETTPVGIMEGNVRKDGIRTKLMRFRVKTKYNNKFINEIGRMK